MFNVHIGKSGNWKRGLGENSINNFYDNIYYFCVKSHFINTTTTLCINSKLVQIKQIYTYILYSYLANIAHKQYLLINTFYIRHLSRT